MIISRHGLNQAISRNGGRGVNPRDILLALRDPKKIVNEAGNTVKYIGKNATEVLSSEGKLITTYGRPRGPQVWDLNGIKKIK